MQNQELAPIVIPVYKRLEHLKKCINSLLSNELAVDTELYIFSDYAFNEKDQTAIDELRAYLKSLSGFKRIIIKEQAENKGLGNIQEAISFTLNLHPAIIYLEEDLEVSIHFLRFMNDQLIKFREDPKIFSISGYSLPCFSGDGEQILGSPSFTAWGCGLWGNKYKNVLSFYAKLTLSKRLKNKVQAIKYIYQHGIQNYFHYVRYAEGGVITPDLEIGFYLWSEDKIQLFPSISLVSTNGYDGSGWHCGNSDKFGNILPQSQSVLINVTKNKFEKRDLKDAYKKICQYHGVGIKNDIKRIVSNPIYYIKKFIK